MTPGLLLSLILLICGLALIAISQLLLKEEVGRAPNGTGNPLESRPFIFWQAVSFCIASVPASFIEEKPDWLPVIAMAACILAGVFVGHWRARRIAKPHLQQTRQQDS